jgi:hypothetical protein
MKTSLVLAIGLVTLSSSSAWAKKAVESPSAVLQKICENASFGKAWIDPKQGVSVVHKDGKVEKFAGTSVLDSSFFEFIEGRHQIECPDKFSGSETICRKTAGGEAYRYFFKTAKNHTYLQKIQIEFEE